MESAAVPVTMASGEYPTKASREERVGNGRLRS